MSNNNNCLLDSYTLKLPFCKTFLMAIFVENLMTKKTKYENYWPDEYEQGLIKTKNSFGMMMRELGPAAVAFVEFAKIAQKPLLDIGAAYGVATLPAIENGAELIACDLNEEHLQILQQATPEYLLSKLTLKYAAFPNDLDFPEKSLSGILISNVLHFLDGNTVEAGLQKCYQWLEPNGKLFLIVMTPYLSFYRNFLPEYEKKAATGMQWPGIFDPKIVSPKDWQDNLPKFVHLFETDTLRRAVEAANFTIETIQHFCYKNFPPEYYLDGKEFISLVARKINHDTRGC